MQERTVKGVVMQMGAHEVWDVVSNMKQLVEKEPDKAKQMFVSHPQVKVVHVCRPFPSHRTSNLLTWHYHRWLAGTLSAIM